MKEAVTLRMILLLASLCKLAVCEKEGNRFHDVISYVPVDGDRCKSILIPANTELLFAIQLRPFSIGEQRVHLSFWRTSLFLHLLGHSSSAFSRANM